MTFKDILLPQKILRVQAWHWPAWRGCEAEKLRGLQAHLPLPHRPLALPVLPVSGREGDLLRVSA